MNCCVKLLLYVHSFNFANIYVCLICLLHVFQHTKWSGLDSNDLFFIPSFIQWCILLYSRVRRQNLWIYETYKILVDCACWMFKMWRFFVCISLIFLLNFIFDRPHEYLMPTPASSVWDRQALRLERLVLWYFQQELQRASTISLNICKRVVVKCFMCVFKLCD